MALLAGGGVSVSAQPVARIALPDPGEAKDLFAGCNLISLTFPDGTMSEDVIDAVTPPEAVEALWRQTATLDRFEGFSPAFPQASDLLTVHRLDPVWICISKTQRPLPPPVVVTPMPVVGTPTPEPTPAPTSGKLADLAITGMTLVHVQPEGYVEIFVVNKGPNSLVNATAELQCNLPVVTPFDDNLIAGSGFQAPISFTLGVGEVGEFPTAETIDVSKGEYTVSCKITNESFTDPNLSNNTKSQTFGPEADLALTGLFAPNQPESDVYARITNNGPDSLENAPVHLKCSYTFTPQHGTPQTFTDPFVLTEVSLVPGAQKAFDTQTLVVYSSLGGWDVNCELWASFDHNQANNTSSLTIPAQTIY
jgi:hypothetical protein